MNARIAGIAVGLAALAAAGSAAAKTTKLTLTEVTTSATVVVDKEPQGEAPSPGDLIAGQAKLMRGAKTVGSASFFGVITAFPELEFYGTFTLPGGRVSVVDLGSLTAAKQSLAIVGGTGRYAGARGVVVETRIAEGRTRDVFTIIT